MTKKTKILLIHGFLGSGKTTLLTQIISLLHDYRCGILQNEFGKINIDGRLISGKSLELIEISNGSIFCSCRHNEFIEGLLKFSDINVDYLLIEASGISDPSSMKRDLKIVERQNIKSYEYIGSICVLDALNVLDLIQVTPIIGRQIRFAELILVNKIDLIDNSIYLQIKDEIRKINNDAFIIPTEYAVIQKGQLNKIFDIKTPEIIEDSINDSIERPLKMLLEKEEKVDKTLFNSVFNDIKEYIWRLKGFIKLKNGNFYIDGVKGGYQLTKTNIDAPKTQIVVIFPADIDYSIIENIKSVWKSI
ncbi:MAG: hypothetical protein GF364_02350 [Candidatus Lokiarchaeota archaeon]|nr:hypothetical protein [Candidatus Lokiarchaeota archaeon]